MYKILLIFLVVGYFYPIIGFLALVCMVGPVIMAVKRGRYWCGHYCPRGNFYDKWIGKFSRTQRIPAIFRRQWFRIFMVIFIFMVFGFQMYNAWGDLAQMGAVFWRIVFVTTVVGILLGVIYRPRTWCSFCPMGTLSYWVSPKKKTKSNAFEKIFVSDECVGCKVCTNECPLEIKVYRAKGDRDGLRNRDCLKCGRCIAKCPKQAINFARENKNALDFACNKSFIE
ncbi:4Fe-4S binding protein [Anaerosinus sp.]